jgi:hypothetical protein
LIFEGEIAEGQYGARAGADLGPGEVRVKKNDLFMQLGKGGKLDITLHRIHPARGKFASIRCNGQEKKLAADSKPMTKFADHVTGS